MSDWSFSNIVEESTEVKSENLSETRIKNEFHLFMAVMEAVGMKHFWNLSEDPSVAEEFD